jgi:hypothetical protein
LNTTQKQNYIILPEISIKTSTINKTAAFVYIL